MISFWKWLVDVLSAEWAFDSGRRANGGAIVIFRALWAASWLYALIVTAAVLIPDPVASPINLGRVASAVCMARTHFEWFGAMFAGIYVGLYSRFSSQWSYLAGVYNQIKQAEATADSSLPHFQSKMSELKAGFIEDAEDLHLATKPMFASVIVAWSDEAGVRESYQKHTRGGDQRFQTVVARARLVHERPWAP